MRTRRARVFSEFSPVHGVRCGPCFSQTPNRAVCSDFGRWPTAILMPGFLLFHAIAGLSESIQRVCRHFDIKTTFKSGS